jgi:hypothetical protein
VSVLYLYHRQLSPRVRVFVDCVSQVYAEVFGARAAPAAASLGGMESDKG